MDFPNLASHLGNFLPRVIVFVIKVCRPITFRTLKVGVIFKVNEIVPLFHIAL